MFFRGIIPLENSSPMVPTENDRLVELVDSPEKQRQPQRMSQDGLQDWKKGKSYIIYTLYIYIQSEAPKIQLSSGGYK